MWHDPKDVDLAVWVTDAHGSRRTVSRSPLFWILPLAARGMVTAANVATGTSWSATNDSVR